MKKHRNLFSIGEVSKMFHISVSSLRHYENIGLLKPEITDEKSGYRYYGTEQFEVLNTIRYLRALELPLSEIEDFLKNRELSRIEEKLKRQKEIVQKKQKELKRIERKIDHRLEMLSDARNTPLDVISVVSLNACRIVWVDDNLQITSFRDMEAPIRKLDRSSAEGVIFLGKVGLGISPENLRQKKTDQYDAIFLILDEEDIYTEETTVLPGTKAVRLRFCGCHTDAGLHYQKLLAYIEDHHMQIAGFSREITMIDYGLTGDPDKFVTEICIPIQ